MNASLTAPLHIKHHDGNCHRSQVLQLWMFNCNPALVVCIVFYATLGARLQKRGCQVRYSLICPNPLSKRMVSSSTWTCPKGLRDTEEQLCLGSDLFCPNQTLKRSFHMPIISSCFWGFILMVV